MKRSASTLIEAGLRNITQGTYTYSSATYLHCDVRKACVTLFWMRSHNPGILHRETREQNQQKLVYSNCI